MYIYVYIYIYTCFFSMCSDTGGCEQKHPFDARRYPAVQRQKLLSPAPDFGC